MAQFARVASEGRSSGVLRFHRKDGSLGWWSVEAVALSPDRLLGYTTDVTALKQAEAEREESHSRMAQLVENIPIAIAMLDTKMNYLMVNQQWLDQYNLGNCDIIGLNHYDVFPEIDDRWKEIHRRCLAGATERCDADTFPRADGSLDFVRWEVRPWYAAPDRIGGLIMNTEVITERKKTEATLRESEQRYRRLFESAKDGILILDAATGMIVDVNPFLIELLGYTHEQFLGKKIWDIGSFADIIANEEAFVVLQRERYVRYEHLPLESNNGSSIDVEFVSNVYEVDGLKVIQCNIRDISARVAAESRRELSIQVLAILNRTNDITQMIKDILLCIKQASGMEAVGLRLHDGDDFPYFETNGFPDSFVELERYLCTRDGNDAVNRDADGHPELACMCGNILRGRVDAQLPFFTAGGSFWSNNTTALLASTTAEERQADTRNRCNGAGYESVALIPLHSGTEIIGLLQLNDHRPGMFTLEQVQFLEGIGASIGVALARRRMADELASEKRLLKTLINTIPDAVYTLDLQGRITLANRTAQSITGDIVDDEQPGHTAHELFPPEIAERLMADIHTVVSSGEPLLNREEILVDLQGNTRWMLESKVPLKNTDGQVVGVVGIAHDITQRKQEEAQRIELEEQLRQQQRLEIVGQLAAGVAHDFNNLLTGITGFTQFAHDDLPTGTAARQDLEEVLALARRAADLTRQLLAFSRRQTLQTVNINLNQQVGDMLKMLGRLIGEHIDLVFHPAADLGAVNADVGQIEQVLVNLVVNARDAMVGGGKLTISTGNVELDEDYASNHLGTLPGQYVMLAVVDNGCGMDASILEHIFEPFYSTKGVGKGTGLGLATVYGIVKQHGGNIWVYSEVGTGTTFKVYLPRIIDEMSNESAPVPAELITGTETILIVEDNAAVLEVTRRVLERHGYRVLTAALPTRATEILDEHGDDIELLLTDIVMPEYSGRELFQTAQAKYPHLQVLYMSGYTDDAIIHHGILDEGTPFIQKPFTSDALLRMVRAALKG